MSPGFRRGARASGPPLLAAALVLGLTRPGAASGSPGTAASDARLPAYRMAPVEVRADPLPDPLGPFPLATRVIARDALARLPGGDLADALRPVAGVRIVGTGSPAAGSFASIRGAGPEQVLVLVDGRRLNSARGGGVDLATLPLDAVESVQVHRGGASALWGAAALGGAVDIRTRAPRPGSLSLRAAGGSRGRRDLSARIGAALGGGWRAGLGGRHVGDDGAWTWRDDRRDIERTVGNADVTRTDLDARVEGPLGPALRLRLDASHGRGERGVPGTGEFPTPTARVEDGRDLFALRLDATDERTWRPTLEASMLRLASAYREPGAAFGPVDESHRNLRGEVSVGIERSGAAGALRLGAGAAIDRLRSTTDGDRRRRAVDVRARGTRDVTVAGRTVRWMGAARLDAVEGFDAFASPRLGVLAELVPGRLRVRASAGLSFRPPGFDDLFWPARATAAGNPDLRAERGRDADAGLSVAGLPGRGRAELTAFVRRVDDLIQWVPGATGIWRPHNVGAARLSGLELEGGAELPLPGRARLGLDLSAARLWSEDLGDDPNARGRELPYRPDWTAAASARLAHDAAGEIELAVRWTGAVWVTRANTKRLPDRLLADLRARRSLGRGLAVDLSLENLADVTARDYRDLPLPGRTWLVGLSWRKETP